MANIREDANPFTPANASEVLNKYGRTTVPAQLNGEGLERTPYLNAIGMARQGVQMPSGRTWSEPGVPYSGSTRGAVWQSTYGGSYIEVGGSPGSEFINVIHKTGARITIAGDGSVTISAAGDVVLTSDENLVEVFDGAKEGVYKAGYTIGVSGGRTVINSTAGIDLVSGQDINILAGGAINLNSGNGIDLASSRIAITAKVDTLDLYAEGKLSVESATTTNVMSAETINIQGKGIGLNGSGGNVSVHGDEVHLNSGESTSALPANKSALGAPPPYVVDTEMPVTYSTGDIQADAIDDTGV